MEYWGNYEQADEFQPYWQGNPHSNFYNENPRNEPDFSWTSNDVQNPPFHPTYHEPYQQPYQPTYQQPYQSTYQEPYQPPFQPTYQEPYYSPYQYSDPQLPNFQQPLPYTPPQPNNDLSELKAMMKQHLADMETLQAESNSRWQREYVLPQEQQSQEIVNTIMPRSGADYNFPKMPEDDEFEVTSKELEVEIVDEVESENETEILVESIFIRPSILQIDRVNHSAPPNTDSSTSRTKSKEPEEPITPEDEVDNHNAVVDALEAALYGDELTRGQGETVSELEHAPKAIEVRTSELQPEEFEVNNLELKLPPSDMNIYTLNDNEDCFVIESITLSEPNPPSLIVSHVYIHETPLEKGHLFCIQDQKKLKPTMLEVAEEEVPPKRNGTRRVTKRCWDPGGFFDKVQIIPWARERDFGTRIRGANGRGMQDDYDDPEDEQVTMHSVN